MATKPTEQTAPADSLAPGWNGMGEDAETGLPPNAEPPAGEDGEKTQDDTQVQYYSRSELPEQEASLHRFSPRRKTTLIGISLLASIILTLAGAAGAALAFSQLGQQPGEDPGRYASRARAALDEVQTRTVGLALGAVAALGASIFIMLRAGPRVIALEFWIRRMGAGDLTYTVRPSGNDEITEIAYDLEVLRRRQVRARQLDLVQELSDDLLDKNEELETVLGELHLVQDQVVSREKLAELGALTAGVAHEIRNPLNLIQNFAQSSEEMMEELRETLGGLDGAPGPEQADLIIELTEDLSGNMQRIRQHGNRANRIISDMLAMGRSAGGKYQVVSINELVEDNAMLAYQSARSRDQEFNMTIVRDLDPDAGEVNVVPEDMGRVILNLVGNACYATAERAGLEPGSEPSMWLRTARKGRTVEITVRDNGNGIPQEIMEKIFNPFFTTKPPDEGTGLGLSLSNDIVREHGGSITPESKLGEYAQFTVRIPDSPPDGRNTAAGPEDTDGEDTDGQ